MKEDNVMIMRYNTTKLYGILRKHTTIKAYNWINNFIIKEHDSILLLDSFWINGETKRMETTEKQTVIVFADQVVLGLRSSQFFTNGEMPFTGLDDP